MKKIKRSGKYKEAISKARNSKLIKGTITLTIAGLIIKLLGFYYRIFLSKALGAENLGLYQMVFPIYGLAYSFSISGIETAISLYVAKGYGKTLKKGLLIALALTIISSVSLYFMAPIIALYLLGDVRSVVMIRMIVLALPFSAIHSCISGYYYGKRKTTQPVVSQLVEQVVRICVGIFLANGLMGDGVKVSAQVAIIAMLCGEISASLISLAFVEMNKSSKIRYSKIKANNFDNTVVTNKQFVLCFLPLTMNRVMLSLLGSIEALLIPLMLKSYGLIHSDALILYGVLTGMAFPFIFFPTIVTNAISTMLLPTVSSYKEKRENGNMTYTISNTLKYCLILGIFCAGIFFTYGKTMGIEVFDNELAGDYITILGCLCPFMYISSTFGSILNGLGLTKTNFYQNIISMLVRIAFVLIAIPYYGIKGYMWGILAAEIVDMVLHIYSVNKEYRISFDAVGWIVVPYVSVFVALAISRLLFNLLNGGVVAMMISIVISFLVYGYIVLMDDREECKKKGSY